MKKLLIKMTNLLIRWCEKRGRVFKITGTAGPDDVYLIRYYVVRSRYFNFFIHQFLRSDRDDLHDHPWSFCTYLVNGAYTENKWNPETKQIEKIRRVNRDNPYSYQTHEVPSTKSYTTSETHTHSERTTPVRLNTFVFRRATDLHQVVVDRDLNETQKNEAALTLFFSGPTIREWGFVKDGQWIDWRTYLGLPPNTPGRG